MMIYTSATFKPRRKSKKVTPTSKKPKQQFVPLKWKAPVQFGPSLSGYKSKLDDYLQTAPKMVEPIRYEGELAEREAAAREHAERLKKCVAPAYNKGAYTLITSEEQAKWIGRK